MRHLTLTGTPLSTLIGRARCQRALPAGATGIAFGGAYKLFRSPFRVAQDDLAPDERAFVVPAGMDPYFLLALLTSPAGYWQITAGRTVEPPFRLTSAAVLGLRVPEATAAQQATLALVKRLEKRLAPTGEANTVAEFNAAIFAYIAAGLASELYLPHLAEMGRDLFGKVEAGVAPLRDLDEAAQVAQAPGVAQALFDLNHQVRAILFHRDSAPAVRTLNGRP
jgi:hypothetical protein